MGVHTKISASVSVKYNNEGSPNEMAGTSNTTDNKAGSDGNYLPTEDTINQKVIDEERGANMAHSVLRIFNQEQIKTHCRTYYH